MLVLSQSFCSTFNIIGSILILVIVHNCYYGNQYTTQTLDITSSSILAREDDMFKRRFSEAIEIFRRAKSLNRDVGYELPAIYWNVLLRDSQYKSRDKKFNSITW